MYIAYMRSTVPNAGCSLSVCLLLCLQPAKIFQTNRHEAPAGRHGLIDHPIDEVPQDGSATHPVQAEIHSWVLEGALGEQNHPTSFA